MKALAVTLAVLAGTVSVAGSAVARPAVGTLSISDAQAPEGNAGMGPLTFRVTLSEVNRQEVTVSYRTQNETARAPEDYASTQGSLEFAPGDTTRSIGVPINGDRAVEPDELFSVILFDSVNAPIAQPGGVGTGTIQNDDQSVAQPPPPARPACTCKRVKTRLTGFNAHGVTALTGNGSRMTEAAEFWDFVVKATMTCGAGEAADCEGFVRTVSPSRFPPFASQKPKLFKCKAKKCSSTSTYTLEVRLKIPRDEIITAREANETLRKKLKLRSGCRGKPGELRTFTLVFTKGNLFSSKLSDLNGK